MKLKLDKITRDDDIYPRTQLSQKTIENYAEALKAGAQFPPILVQRIKENSTEKTISLDGFHRLEAHKKAEMDGIEAEYWKAEVLNKMEWLEELRIKSAQCNLSHGDRLREGDLQFQLLRIVQARSVDKLVGIIHELAQRVAKTDGYISQLIGAEVNRRKTSRDALAYRLHLLGWAEREISEVIGVKNTHDVLENFNTKLFLQEYRSGLTPEKIATNYNLDEALVWAILLEGKNDIERFKLFGNSRYGNEQPEMSDYWKFAERDPRLGQANYPGNLYGQEAMNIIYRFSRQGDLVIDPMAGGGTIIDACLILGRRCRASDINPAKSERHDIEMHNALEPLPDRTKECHLVILDPPYFKKKETEYGCDEFTKDRDTFLNNMKVVAQNCHNILKQGGYLALLYGQYLDYDNEFASILSFDLATCIVELNFRPVLCIQSPLTFNNQWHGSAIEKAKQYNPWRILPVSKDWLVFKKV